MKDMVVVGLSLNKGLVNSVLRHVSSDPDLTALSECRSQSGNGQGNAFDAWKLLLPGMSDAHGVRALSQSICMSALASARSVPAFVYTGIPYYDVHFVDSISVVWNKQWQDDLEGSMEVARFGKEVTLRNGASHRLYSDFGYGIVFLSDFMSRLAKRKTDPLSVSIAVEDETARQICEEVVLLCGDPRRTPYADTPSRENAFIIAGIRWISGDESKPSMKQLGEFGSDTRSLPFKRFVAFPRNAHDCPIALPASARDVPKLRVFSLGGVEHNLATLHLLALHRWRTGTQKLLVAGNAFGRALLADTKRVALFSESYVTTLDGIVRQRQSDKNRAIVYRLELPEAKNPKCPSVSFYGIQGYSGLMTRVALLTLLSNLKPGGSKKHAPGINRVLEYELPESKARNRDNYFRFDDAVSLWDELDCMNDIASAVDLISSVKARSYC